MLPTTPYYQKPPLTRCQQNHLWYIQDSSEQECQHDSLFFLVESSVLKFFMMATIVLLARRDLFLRNFRLENLNHLGSYMYIYIYSQILQESNMQRALQSNPMQQKNNKLLVKLRILHPKKWRWMDFTWTLMVWRTWTFPQPTGTPTPRSSAPQKTTWPFLWLINLPSLMYHPPRNSWALLREWFPLIRLAKFKPSFSRGR